MSLTPCSNPDMAEPITTRPSTIYYKGDEIDAPFATLIDRLRSEMVTTRGKIYDLERIWPHGKDRIEHAAGGLTCIISALANSQEEIKSFEERHGSMATWVQPKKEVMNVKLTVRNKDQSSIVNPDMVVRALSHWGVMFPYRAWMHIPDLTVIEYPGRGKGCLTPSVQSLKFEYAIPVTSVRWPHDNRKIPTFEEQAQEFEVECGKYTVHINTAPEVQRL